MKGRALADLMIVIRSDSGAPTRSAFNRVLRSTSGRSQMSWPSKKQQVEHEKDQRSLAGVGRVLDQAEGRSAIGRHPAEFAIQVGVLSWQACNGLGDGGVLLSPVVASAG